MKTRCALVSGSFVLALLLAHSFTAHAAATDEKTAGGCSHASRAVLDDIIGSVSGDPFLPNPSIGGASGTDPSGCGRPNHTRKQDPGNPVTAVARPTSSFTILGVFP